MGSSTAFRFFLWLLAYDMLCQPVDIHLTFESDQAVYRLWQMTCVQQIAAKAFY